MENKIHFRFILVAAVCSAIAGTLLAAGYITFLYVRKGSPAGVGDVIAAFFVGTLFAAIPAGFFGLVAGAAGGSWLVFRRGRFKSSTDVARAGALAGAALGALYPAFSLLLHWTSAQDTRAVLVACAVGLGIGVFCGWFFGRVFGSMLLNGGASKTH